MKPCEGLQRGGESDARVAGREVAVGRARPIGQVIGMSGRAGSRAEMVRRAAGLRDVRTARWLPPSNAASYLGVVLEELIIAPSALKHGLGKEDVLQRLPQPHPGLDLGDGFTMMLGPNAAAIILEVGYVEGDTAVVIVHAMRARKRFLQ